MTHHAWIIPHRQQGSLRAGTCSPLRPETQRIRLRFARSTFLPRLKRRRGSAPAARGKDAQRRAARGAAARIAERRKRSSLWSRRSDRGKTRHRPAPDDEKTKRRPGSRKARPPGIKKKSPCERTRREARFGKRRQASSTMTRGEAPDGAGKCSSRPKSSCAGRESCLLCISSSTANS